MTEDKNWALFDQDWKYKGGVVSPEGPDAGENPEGYQVVEVQRFPAPFEVWDKNRHVWVVCDKARRTQEDLADQALLQTHGPLIDLIERRTQAWLYSGLQNLGVPLTEEQAESLFPKVLGK
jgi:hypothetical protein